MTLAEKKLWLLVAKQTGSNLEARMIYDELIKQLKMEEERSIMLQIVETESGMEIHVNEKAYGNFGLVGLIEHIKMTLLTKEDTQPEKRIKTPKVSEQKYYA